jgi:hypothetical protein
MNKGQLLFFTIGVTITVSAFGFFGQMMQMPNQMFQTGSQMIMPQAQPTKCNCACSNNP